MSEYFIHHLAICESPNIGRGTKIWAFSHVLPGARIGRDCNIGEHCFIENDVIIGDECVIKNNIAIWDGVRIENRVFLGPNVVLTNDLRPRAKIVNSRPIPTLFSVGSSTGANATIVCGVTIGAWAIVGAGSVVTKSVPDFGLVYGNPARLHGFVCACTRTLSFMANEICLCTCGKRYRRESATKVVLL